jgi:hypothetical protein
MQNIVTEDEWGSVPVFPTGLTRLFLNDGSMKNDWQHEIFCVQ